MKGNQTTKTKGDSRDKMSLTDRQRLAVLLLITWLLPLSNAGKITNEELLEDDYDYDDDPLLEMSVGDRQNMARHVGLHAAFLTQKERLKKAV